MIAPPSPPRALDMRRTASRAQSIAPVRLTSTTRAKVSGSASANDERSPVMPPLWASTLSVPTASTAANKAETSPASAASARTACAAPPSASIAPTTSCAWLWLLA